MSKSAVEVPGKGSGFNFDLCRRNEMLVNKGAAPPSYRKTGTTIVGLVFKDGVILGADTRATKGPIVCDKNCEKIHHMAPNIYCCGAGTAADTEAVTGVTFHPQNVYYLGGRTFWIHTTGPLGCLPLATHYYHNLPAGALDENGCVKDLNDLATEFNNQLKAKVAELRKLLPDAALVYVDMYAAKLGLICSAKTQGFVDPNEICCGYHEGDTHVYCGSTGLVNGTQFYAGSCKDPASHISWDGIHYTDTANFWLARRVANGSFSDPPVSILQACNGRV